MEQLAFCYKINRFIYLNRSTSTNEYAANVSAINKPNHNYCIYTYNQTDGRGQIGSKWYSGEQNNLAVSFIINNIKLSIKDQFELNIAVSLAIFETLSHYISPEIIKIKWPNDIYIKNKKIAGILIQNQIKGNQLSKCIIGIGLNVNETTFPDDLPNPISLFQSTHKERQYSLYSILKLLTELLQKSLSQIQITPSLKRKQYVSRLFRIEEEAHFSIRDKLHLGTIKGIQQDGKLMVKVGQEIEYFGFREIKYII